MTTMRVVGECFFWYWLTRVFPDKFHRAVKRLCVCVLLATNPTALQSTKDVWWPTIIYRWVLIMLGSHLSVQWTACHPGRYISYAATPCASVPHYASVSSQTSHNHGPCCLAAGVGCKQMTQAESAPSQRQQQHVIQTTKKLTLKIQTDVEQSLFPSASVMQCTCQISTPAAKMLSYTSWSAKKWYTGFLVITSPKVNRFLKLFHCRIYKETICVPVIKTSTSPEHTLLHYLEKFKSSKYPPKYYLCQKKLIWFICFIQNLTKFGVCKIQNITGMIYLISITGLYRMQTA